jgi:hypothetical protein
MICQRSNAGCAHQAVASHTVDAGHHRRAKTRSATRADRLGPIFPLVAEMTAGNTLPNQTVGSSAPLNATA